MKSVICCSVYCLQNLKFYQCGILISSKVTMFLVHHIPLKNSHNTLYGIFILRIYILPQLVKNVALLLMVEVQFQTRSKPNSLCPFTSHECVAKVFLVHQESRKKYRTSNSSFTKLLSQTKIFSFHDLTEKNINIYIERIGENDPLV